MFHEILHNITTAASQSTNWYHLAAFILTGAGAQYSVQIIKVISKNKYGKGVLRFLNGAFSLLYVAAGAFITGGMTIGSLAETSAALTAVSVVIYRIHNSFLYSSGQKVVEEALDIQAAAAQLATPVATPSNSFSQSQ